MNDLGPFILGAVGLLIVVLAWQIRSGATWMLSGYQADRVADERGIASWCGNGLLLLGFITVAFALAFARLPAQTALMTAVYVVIVGMGVAIIAFGARRFRRGPGTRDDVNA
jgi:drug/metabolite transporter (DMT)-like permease